MIDVWAARLDEYLDRWDHRFDADEVDEPEWPDDEPVEPAIPAYADWWCYTDGAE